VTVRAASIVLLAALAAGCGREPAPYPQLTSIEGLPRGVLHGSSRGDVLVGEFPLGLEAGSP
jgi:hypothetical protein